MSCTFTIGLHLKVENASKQFINPAGFPETYQMTLNACGILFSSFASLEVISVLKGLPPPIGSEA
jgi:hypothetical protein